MARISAAQHEVEETVVTLASLGLMCCMVVTLMGIKIWWFKHRLSFDQSSASNGAAGGTQPRIVTRTRSSKDKRLSQQFREPVLVHGVFRKRQEDELETFERPKLLPPIRERKLSQSTPELFQAPIRPATEQVTKPEFLDIPAPPRRKPPKPPTRQASATTTASAPTPPPIFEKIIAIPITSSPLTEEPEVNAVEFHSSEDDEDFFFRPETPEIKTELAPTPRARKPLKRNRSHNLEGVEHRFLRTKTTSFEKCKPDVNLMERRATGFERPSELEWQQFHEDEVDHSNSDHRQEEGQLRKWEDLESYSDEMLNLEPQHFAIQEFNNKKVVFQVVDPVEPEFEEEQEHYSTWTLKRRPTGFATSAPILLTDLDSEEEESQPPQAQRLDASEKLWQEMERDIDRDFASNIEEEFNKIRHSYEANEEGFLEESTNELDTGYGKSIDEDWENFEKLNQCDSKIEPEMTSNLRVIKADLLESDEESLEEENAQQQKVHFKLRDDYNENASDEETESATAIRQRRPTGFESSTTDQIKLADLVEQDANEVATDRAQKVSFQLSDEEDIEDNAEAEQTILKQRRPTGYIKREDFANLMLETDDEEEDDKEFEEEKLETNAIIKAKPRQKVTFNFTTQVRELDNDEILADEELYSEQPKPMQRMTILNGNDNDFSPARTENTAALLFSTQVSAEYATTDEATNDSWSAIRLHRQLTDEFQQITLEEAEHGGAKVAPKAAYRNPLAQVDAGNGTQDFSIIAKPRTMRNMKKAQARQTMHVQQYDGSATEA